MSAFGDLAGIGPQRIWAGVAARAVHGDRVTFSVIELEPDRPIPEHSHESEQVGILLSGSLTFRVGDETRELGAGNTWCIHSHVPHEIHVGPAGAVVIEAFSPIRADWETIEREHPRPPQWPAPA